MNIMGMSGMSGMSMSGPDESLPSPDSVSNLILWMRASMGVYEDPGVTPATDDGDAVAAFTNLASTPAAPGQGGTATAGNRPLLKLNQIDGKPVLRFDGVNDFFMLFGGGIGAPFPDITVFAVVKATDVSGVPAIISGAAPNTFGVGINAAGKISLLNGGAEFAAGTTTLSTSAFSLICVTMDQPAGDWAVYLNGAADGTGTSVQVFGQNLLCLGAGSEASGANPLLGDLADLLVYTKLLDTTERAVVTDWIKSHYSLP